MRLALALMAVALCFGAGIYVHERRVDARADVPASCTNVGIEVDAASRADCIWSGTASPSMTDCTAQTARALGETLGQCIYNAAINHIPTGNTWHPAHIAVVGTKKPSWGDPAAAVVAIGGLAIAAAILATRRRRPVTA